MAHTPEEQRKIDLVKDLIKKAMEQIDHDFDKLFYEWEEECLCPSCVVGIPGLEGDQH